MRLTLDLDIKALLGHRAELFKKLENVSEYFPENPLEVWETKNGYHVIVYDVNLTSDEVKEMRIYFGDDWKRVKIDTFKVLSPKQVLWTTKGDFKPKKIIEIGG